MLDVEAKERMAECARSLLLCATEIAQATERNSNGEYTDGVTRSEWVRKLKIAEEAISRAQESLK